MKRDTRKERLELLYENILNEIQLNGFGNEDIYTIKDVIHKMIRKPVNTPTDIQLASRLMRIYLGMPLSKTMVSYAPLYSQIAKYDLSLSTICSIAGINTTIRKQIKDNKPVHMDNLLKIADVLDCKISELYEEIDETESERRLNKQRSFKRRSALYDLTQLSFQEKSEDGEARELSIDDEPHVIEDRYRINVRTADIAMIKDFYFGNEEDQYRD